MENNIIEVNMLEKSFGRIKAVDGVTFNVGRGEVFGFLGPNGAGKTTTINVLCTLMKPTSGKASVNGFDVLKDKHKVRESIGLVFQEQSLDERLTAIENLEFHAAIYNVPKGERDGRIIEVLNMVELTERAKDRVETFSGGMKRRLEIARGLLHFPDVLFLDEPTIGLDPHTRNYIWEYIGDLKRREDISIFLTTHYMDEAEHCDRIAIIDYGKIIALDTPEGLKNMVGGDVIRIKTEDDKIAAKEIMRDYQIKPFDEGEVLCFEVEKGEEFMPRLIRGLSVRIDAINLHRPTLDDVFLKLTGREIRSEGAEELSSLRKVMKMKPPIARR